MRARRLIGWSAAAVVLTLVLLLAAALGSAWWALRSERGSAWLLSHVPGLEVEAPRGALLGDFGAARVVVHLAGDGRVTLAGLAWRGLTVARGASPLWLRVGLESLAIARVDIVLAPGKNSAPLKPPADLRLPVELDLRALTIGELHLAALGDQPLRALSARVHLSAGGGAEHRVDGLVLDWDRLHAQADATIASAAPMALNLKLQLASQAAAALPAWSANATLAGPLAEPTLKATLATLAATATPGTLPKAPANTPSNPQPPAPQALDLRATLRPFAAWPLGELRASTQSLDLSAFASAAPRTALTGTAIATTSAANAPAQLTLDLRNALPGRWNDGALPLHHLAAELVGRLDRPDSLSIRQLTLELGTPRAGAGTITGAGQWSPAGWTLDATLADVQPALLDARGPPMRLGGPLKLAGGAQGNDAAIDLQTALAGTVDALKPARSVQLRLSANIAAQRIELRELQALAGGARAQASGLLTQAAPDAPWAVKMDAALVDFDPALWWPGRSDAAWRGQPNRLNASAKIDLRVPLAGAASAAPASASTAAPGAAPTPLARLALLTGQAALTLKPSTLAGVALSGSATLNGAAGAPLATALELVAEGNRIHASGHLATRGSGADDAWDLTLDGPALARLAPLYRLLDPGADKAALGGTLQAQAHVGGRWPALTTRGQLDASALRIGPLTLQQATGRWSLGSSTSAPLDAQLNVTQAALASGGAPGPSIETAHLQLNGSGRAHTLLLQAESKARPPAWVDTVQPPPAASDTARTIAQLQISGGLVDLPAAPLGGWRGTLTQLDVRSSASAANAAYATNAPNAPNAATTANAAPLLHAANIAFEALWAGGPTRLSVQPGRAELLGGAVRWNKIGWTAAATDGGFAQIEAEAEVEPLHVAPLLARAQPGFGWGGDLALGAHLKLRSAPTFQADIVVERTGGDLSVTDEDGTRTLGLTDLRLGLAAADGTWNFTQGLAGRSVGVAAGAVVVHTAPQATWPTADAPLQGVLELRVPDIGTWGNWVPAGWRLGGAVHASASINGRFGAPEYTGQVEGTQLAVRNFLQGVNISDGDVVVKLQGNSARIEHFSAKAGSGSLSVSGDASLGAAPKAVLQLSADKFQLLGRVDRRIVASGSGRLQLDASTLAFDGRFGVDEGLIDFSQSDAPTLSDDVEVVRVKAAPSAASAPDAALPANPSRAVALDLKVSLGNKLRLRGHGLDTKLGGELHITSPGGKLSVNGTVNAIDGTFAAYGQKLSVDKGVIVFNGPIENPRLDIEATRPNLDVRVGVAVSGNASDPRVRLFSEPELSDVDKISWLVMGRASDGLGRTDTALLQRAALALLSGDGESVTDKVTKAIGLDDIGVRQETDSNNVQETVVSLGKQLSRRWYVGYERGLNATTGNFQLIYRIAQRFTLRAQSGDDSSLDFIWTWRWK